MKTPLKSVVHSRGRIVFVEPNDLNGVIGDVPMTPDYTDMCISFNLIVEVVSRYKRDVGDGTNSDGSFIISWTSFSGGEKDKNWVSFLRGEDGFLTTYYTDAHYETIRKENIVEGLGIENINVAFENYYTPTVTIKFVDVRGMSLFGREEETHYGDELKVDSIFGAFFTAPYPKFKLQIKGFYGKPVTLQLTCSGFKGMLNPNTGNFEATATFVGYSYSLLTDIPFQYIVAAPYCDYFGSDYWEKMSTDSQWVPFDNDGKPLPKIYEFVMKVLEASTNDELLNILDNDQEKIIQNHDIEISEIEVILAKLNDFIAELEKETVVVKDFSIVNPDNEEQIFLMCNEETKTFNENVKIKYSELSGLIKKYSETHAERAVKEESMLFESWKIPEKITLVKLFEPLSGEDGKVKVTFTDQNNRLFKPLNGGKVINKNYEETFKKLIESGTNILRPYVYIIDFHGLRKKFNGTIDSLHKEIVSIKSNIDRDYEAIAKTHIGMVPSVGNIFKMIMAHVDTLVYMMMKCYENIMHQTDSGLRTMTNLGVKVSDLDVVDKDENSNVPPWPMVFSATGSPYRTVEDTSTIGWVGDFSHNFEEEKLIRSLFLACKRTSKTGDASGLKTTPVNYIPVLPFDVNGINFVFNSGKDGNVSTLAGMLGLRVAQIFGVMDPTAGSDVAKCAGEMDAYNYYCMLSNKDDIREKLLRRLKSFETDLYGIMVCAKDADSYGNTIEGTNVLRHTFETNLIKGDDSKGKFNGRHPIFVESGSNLSYVHYFTKYNKGLIPSQITDFSIYTNYFPISKSNDYFNLVVSNEGGYNTVSSLVRNCNDSTLFYGENVDCKKTINDEMFNVITNMSEVNGIVNRYKELSSGTFNMFGDSYKCNFSKILDRYWQISDSYYNKILSKGKKYLFSVTPLKLGFSENNFLKAAEKDPEVTEKFGKKTFDFSGLYAEGGINFKEDGKISCKIDGKDTTVELSDLYVPSLPVYCDTFKFNIFSSAFWYLQNYHTDKKTKMCIKALLFAHSAISYLSDLKLNFLDKDKKHGSLQAIPRVYAIFLGGLLWRHQIIEQSGIDPILFAIPTTSDDKTAICFKEAYDGNIEYTLLGTANNVSNVYVNILQSSNRTNYTVKFSDVFPKMPDYHVTNALIRMFVNFANGSEFIKIVDACEIKNKKGEDTYLNTFLGDKAFGELDTSLLNVIYNITSSGEKEKCGNNPAEVNKVAKEIRGAYESYSYFGGIPNCIIGFSSQLSYSNSALQDALKNIILGRCIITDSHGTLLSRTETEPDSKWDIVVTSEQLKSYLTGFHETLKSISGEDKKPEETTAPKKTEETSGTESGQTSGGSETETEQVSNSENSESSNGENDGTDDELEFKRDLAVPIYLYLKMLWDKWLMASNFDWKQNEYRVENFFNKNFIFIDSFYRDISHCFMLNCELFLNIYENINVSNKDQSVFKVIADLSSQHNCMFLSMPEFIGELASKESSRVVSAMDAIFRPTTYSPLTAFENNNKFVVIYIPKLSETPSDLNGFKEDTFDIWSYNDSEDSSIGSLPSALFDVEDVQKRNSSYYIPAFGLVYGRQANSIFKSVNLSMETPIITSSVINTLAHITTSLEGSRSKVAFIGQDLYPVFSNYSYICEFEMMGCAQIQPLMYFQLMNVPMWRGTYMIFNVVHDIKPGSMTTKVRAMKLSSKAVPYSSTWYTKNFNYVPPPVYNINVCPTGYELDGSSSGTSSGDGLVTSPDGVTSTNSYFSSEPVNDRSNLYIVVNKSYSQLSVYEGNPKESQKAKLIARVRCGLGSGTGPKTKVGDHRTPETKKDKWFDIEMAQDSSEWRHDFKDGSGNIKAYGPYFLRLRCGFSGIGIHGSVSGSAAHGGENTIGYGKTRDSEGCIRLFNSDIKEIVEKIYGFQINTTFKKEKYKVFITRDKPDQNNDVLPGETPYTSVPAF